MAEKEKRKTPAQRLGEAYDQMARDHNTIDQCLDRLEILALEMGWHAEMFHRLDMPRSAASSKDFCDRIEAFCKAKREACGFNDDIPW
jgi:hypothetical protein